MQHQLFEHFIKEKQFEKAEAIALAMVKQDAKNVGAWWSLAQVQLQLKKYESAVDCLYEVCQTRTPYFSPAVALATTICFEQQMWDLGVTPARFYAQLNPKDYNAQFRLAVILQRSFRYRMAIEAYTAALDIKADSLEAAHSLLICYLKTGNAEEALKQGRAFLERWPAETELLRLLVLIGNYCPKIENAELFELHRQYARGLDLNEPSTRVPKLQDRVFEKRVLGIYSGSLRKHSVAYFLEGVLQHLDRSAWKLVAISINETNDAFTDRIRSQFDVFIDANGLGDNALVKRVSEENLDVFLDLEGLFLPVRSCLFKDKLAKVYAGYLGYPNTIGLPQADFRLTDRYADPPGESDRFYTEKLRYFDRGFLCYRASEEAPEIAIRESEQPFVFGSFNSFEKISREVLFLWAQILKAVPDAQLVMKSASLGDEMLLEELYSFFSSNGVERSRLRFLIMTPSTREHLDCYGLVDMQLDPFPFNGATTTFEALWQGVPSLAIAGSCHRARVSACINQHLGLDEFVVSDEQEYVKKAISWAKNKDQLRSKRTQYRALLRDSHLMDEAGFTSGFEKLLTALLNETQSDHS